MSAQTAAEPSMEDILASIRKIITDDSNEDAANFDVSNSSPNVDNFSPEKAMQQSTPTTTNPPASTSNPARQQNLAKPVSANGLKRPNPPILRERRDFFPDDYSDEPVPPKNNNAFSAQPNAKPENLVKPAAQNNLPKHLPTHGRASPLQTDFARQETGTLGAQNLRNSNPDTTNPNSASLNTKLPPTGRDIPGFVERKPSVAGSRPTPPAPSFKTDEPLHPAIAIAKDIVSASNEIVKAPQNSNFAAPAITHNNAPTRGQHSDFISPDSVERRNDDERRNHPLRRDADRNVEKFNGELISSTVKNSVQTSFEQLKSTTTDDLDGSVENLLRPMLREWLDNNLPSMVERLVRDEIERVSRGE